VSPEEWFERFVAELPDAPTDVSDEERASLLDLARVAAHTSERWTAPVTTFLAGVALATTPPDHRAATLRELVARLESYPGG
jgi:hypothetical protein